MIASDILMTNLQQSPEGSKSRYFANNNSHNIFQPFLVSLLDSHCSIRNLYEYALNEMVFTVVIIHWMIKCCFISLH